MNYCICVLKGGNEWSFWDNETKLNLLAEFGTLK